MKQLNETNIPVTGIGLVSTLGNTLELFWEGLRQRSRTTIITGAYEALSFDESINTPAGFPTDAISPENRILEMGSQAITSAVNNWGGDLKEYPRICLVVGSGLGLSDQLIYERGIHEENKYYLASLGRKLAGYVNANCEHAYIGNACCAGSQAICYGMDLLLFDHYDLVICGGIDSFSSIAHAGFLRLNAIDALSCKPFDKDRKGIAIGEGAVFFILEKQKDAVRRNRSIYCVLSGYGTTNDAYHVVQIKEDGADIKRAMEQALTYSRLEKSEVDLIIAHGTGTILNDRIEAKAISEFFGENLKRMYVTAPKGAIGHTGGASGGFGLLTAAGAICHGGIPSVCNLFNPDNECKIPLVMNKYLKHDINAVMVSAFAFGGTNVVIICKKWYR